MGIPQSMASEPQEIDTDTLLHLAKAGDESARQELLMRHRDRLKRMIAVFLDPRVAARVDPSDILQETLTGAALKLTDFLKDRPGDFYPWLRRIARDRITDAHRRHIGAKKRSVNRESRNDYISTASTAYLVDRLISKETSPSAGARRSERRQQILDGLQRLSDSQREVMLMRYVELLSVREIAETLSLSESAVKSRLWRALEKMQELMGGNLEDQP